VLKIQLFRDFLLYRLVNNYQISKDRDAFIFRVPQFFEISLTTCQLTQRYIPEDLHPQQSHNTRCLSLCVAKFTVELEMTEWAVTTARHVNCLVWQWLINIDILRNVVWSRREFPKVSELPIRAKNGQWYCFLPLDATTFCVSLVSFTAKRLCVASQWMFLVVPDKCDLRFHN